MYDNHNVNHAFRQNEQKVHKNLQLLERGFTSQSSLRLPSPRPLKFKFPAPAIELLPRAYSTFYSNHDR